MEQKQQLIECNSCKKSFPVSAIELYPRIVRKGNMVAVAYCFKCPECGQEYICYFKDSQVNALLRKGDIQNAKARMQHLKELFTNDHTV